MTRIRACVVQYSFTKLVIIFFFFFFFFLIESVEIYGVPFVHCKNDKMYLTWLAIMLIISGPGVVYCNIKPAVRLGLKKRCCCFGRMTSILPPKEA
jgi:hypothetical protein